MHGQVIWSYELVEMLHIVTLNFKLKGAKNNIAHYSAHTQQHVLRLKNDTTIFILMHLFYLSFQIQSEAGGLLILIETIHLSSLSPPWEKMRLRVAWLPSIIQGSLNWPEGRHSKAKTDILTEHFTQKRTGGTQLIAMARLSFTQIPMENKNVGLLPDNNNWYYYFTKVFK